MKTKTTTPLSRHIRGVFCAVVLSTLSLGLIGCGPSEEDLEMGRVRAGLAAQQSQLVAQSGDCMTGIRVLTAWRTAHQSEIAASDAWWSNLSDRTKDQIYEAYPEFRQANGDRGVMLVRCGSSNSLWDPSF